MKSATITHLLFMSFLLFQTQLVYGQFGQILDNAVEKGKELSAPGIEKKLLSMLEKRQPVSTSFDDAIYEADELGNFEPQENEYKPLDLQPRLENGSYRLQSGVYTMDSKSFCLRGYTHGPSRGDGHLYAPLKGQRADLVQSIIERYGMNPDVPQQEVQVLLWGIIAGADTKTLGKQYAHTLSRLFTASELAKLAQENFVDDLSDGLLAEAKKFGIKNLPPQVTNILDANRNLKSMVQQNKTFAEIEKLAVIAGVAPKDMIREVSKGRWSYHPDGFFVRFFPNGYAQTRVDVYVPYKDAVQTNKKGKVVKINYDARQQPKEVVVNLSYMVASPANRPSQRVGMSNVSKESYEIIFYSFNRGKKVPISKKDPTEKESVAGHMYIAFVKNNIIEKVKGFSPREPGQPIDGGAKVDNNTDERYLLNYHTRCFPIRVSRLQYEKALSTTMEGYKIGANDCVSYVDKVAELLGLSTPSAIFDPTVFPDSYMEYLQTNNEAIGTPNHKLCD